MLHEYRHPLRSLLLFGLTINWPSLIAGAREPSFLKLGSLVFTVDKLCRRSEDPKGCSADLSLNFPISEDRMRFITFARQKQQRIGLLGPQDQIIDVAEITRRYLRGGNLPYLASMQAFIEAGSKALQAGKKAEKDVAGKRVE